MANKQPAKSEANPKEALAAEVKKRESILAKQAAKAGNDPKRRLAHKKLKRAQRRLGKLVAMEKKAAAAAASKAAPAE